ncbi:PAS sensor protein [Streptomyces pluripotens]|uniref:protein-serine/threonine phosphatase n=1 Tax=Streptomyces pluripotens TaxID=1355015 RepID=A0A221P7B6_9ACTN|nr:PAS sensor protein [Streptomyces pluripotens]ASN28141.1 PAS sensor protein [Streptomyces pluripotens]KIE27889.1 PAS/PAC sensor protein [Streptomyces sp. MUSC 125]
MSEGAAISGSRMERAEAALDALTAVPGTPDLLRRILEQALVFAGAAFAGVYTPGDDPSHLGLAESAGLPRTLYGLRDGYPAAGGSPVAEAHRSGRPVWLGPAARAGYPGERRTPTADFSLAALPLRPPGSGCLLAVSEHPGGFGGHDRTCLGLIARAVVVPVPAATVADTGVLPKDSFSLAMDTGRVEVGDTILRLFGIGRNDFDGRVETLLERTVPEDLPALMSVVEADHMSIGDRELEFRVLRPSGTPRWLRLRGRLLPKGEGRPARLVGTVVDASTLRSGVTDVTRVQRLAAALATAGTVKDVGQAVVAALRKPLQADRIALAELEHDRLVVTVLDPPEPEAWPEVWRSEWRTEWPDAPVRTMPTLAAALREGRARIWPARTELEPALAEVGPGGLAVLPLPAGGRMAGACLIGWDRPHDFGPDERALLTACAGLIGQALLRAHAFDAEHELVGMLQRTLLPRRLPRLPGAVAVARYLPTTAGLEVGGDWYDVIPLADNHVALVIGDVQGHNAGAATLMGQMRTALRAYAAEGHAPDVVVAHANRLLLDMETDLFATCAYVDVDLEEGTAWCVRAGHLQPVLRHPDGSAEIVQAEGGPPLGVLGQAEFPMTPLRLQPGMVLALTTDGLVESAGADIDTGMDRLARELAAADPGHLGLVADALLTGAHRGDDVALLLMRYDGMTVRPLRESWTVWRLPEAVRHARRFTRRTLRGWGVPGETVDVALLVVSELVTNALVHTEGQVRLDLSLVGQRLRLAVADSSPRSPMKPTSVGWEATGGRGILLVEAVSEAWGTLPVSGGKQVWADLAPAAESPLGYR